MLSRSCTTTYILFAGLSGFTSCFFGVGGRCGRCGRSPLGIGSCHLKQSSCHSMVTERSVGLCIVTCDCHERLHRPFGLREVLLFSRPALSIFYAHPVGLLLGASGICTGDRCAPLLRAAASWVQYLGVYHSTALRDVSSKPSEMGFLPQVVDQDKV